MEPDGKADPVQGGGIIGMDPPRHNQIRGLISQVFTPRVVAKLEPWIASIVDSLLNKVAYKGEMDFVEDLAFLVPVMVIAELLGVPVVDRDKFRQWSTDYLRPDNTPRANAINQMVSYFREMIKLRMQEPREDLVSDLIRAEVDGEHLSEEEILGTCITLLVAGHETTTGLMGNAFVCLDDHAEAKQELLDQPDLIPSAIEEVLRYRAVVHTAPRVAMTDTVIAGQVIKAGELVSPLYASANLDETYFPAAGTFDIHRTPNRHMGFGYGIHFCIGSNLARLEARIMLEMVLDRFPTIQRVKNKPLTLKPSFAVYSFQNMPVKW
jgi:cytochrome P450